MAWTEEKTLTVFKRLLPDLYNFAKDYLRFNEDVENISFISKKIKDVEALSLGIVLGSTGYYDPETKTIGVYLTDRHPKDVLRSFAHELVHHAQFQDEILNSSDILQAKPGYAQEDEKLRKAEVDAYQRGNIMFRDWEDQYKSENDSGALLNEQEQMHKTPDFDWQMNIDELKPDQLSLETLEALRNQVFEKSRDPEENEKLDEMFQIVVGDKMSDLGFFLESHEQGDTYVYDNGELTVTFNLYGMNGLPGTTNPYGPEENSNLVMKLEWLETEGSANNIGVSEEEYKTVKDAIIKLDQLLDKKELSEKGELSDEPKTQKRKETGDTFKTIPGENPNTRNMFRSNSDGKGGSKV